MNNLTYAAIMFIAGIGIPIMAALNGGLGVKLQSPVLAACVLFSVGLALAISVLMLTGTSPKAIYTSPAPWYLYFGGCFVIFYILSITAIAPHFGVGNAVSFVLLGQLVAMTAIDHFGLMGAPRFELSTQRIGGLLLMVAGVFLVVRRT